MKCHEFELDSTRNYLRYGKNKLFEPARIRGIHDGYKKRLRLHHNDLISLRHSREKHLEAISIKIVAA